MKHTSTLLHLLLILFVTSCAPTRYFEDGRDYPGDKEDKR